MSTEKSYLDLLAEVIDEMGIPKEAQDNFLFLMAYTLITA